MTTPILPGLVMEDISDAPELAGLRLWIGTELEYRGGILLWPNTILAGNGHGFCSDERN